MTIRSTYALDVETARRLERLAKEWGVSKSEALRRSIQAATGRQISTGDDALQALDILQRSANLSAVQARQWASQVRTARRSSSARRWRRP